MLYNDAKIMYNDEVVQFVLLLILLPRVVK